MSLTKEAAIVMTPAEVGTVLELSEEELRRMRRSNEGPAFYSIGGRLICYNTTDVLRWRASRVLATPL